VSSTWALHFPCRAGHSASASADIAVIQPAAELLPDRTPRAEVAGQVAPLAASKGLVEDGVDHPTTRDAGPSTPSAGRVEQVTDEAPLGIGQVGCIGHDRDGAHRPSRGTRRSAFRIQGPSRPTAA
jgi:hypothetical protein